ncbi:ParB/RepB/Spo0J family partition protein [Suipraeoptans intestinalis]|uniref:ParB-like N-terminal domain-containing protein n=1 Tax=Suipraeoptans intestinalis TaxID=2606628 RepID=A0A6N7USR4_9FIRM|nr:ParB N-terminal domain-containing protein [Suipraeoptans intestinalis]MDD7770873.1 ParB N-terminal domain-containing protein [Suipraeoptans intestinalis]MDY3122460.1 ParB N-terminal domain-containing protein [Suipraeoptans intestinalis]MSR93754.1 hypothetical protein [Suipraeoptans intestinalis]
MGKFNLSKIRGTEGLLNEDGGMKAGLGLLNDVSRGDMDLLYLDRRQIEKNKRNFYKIGEIESLAQSIADVGLKQPLEVKPIEGNKFELLSGERRLTAIDLLIEKGIWQKVIPCVVTVLDKIDLPLDEEEKEMYSIITTNREQRDYTDGEIARELQELRRIYKKLKDQGVERLKKADGSEVELKGKREREVLSETLGISTGKVAQFDKVEHQGSPALMDVMLEDKISSNTAAQVADMPVEVQEDFLQKMQAQKKIEGKDLKKYQEEQKGLLSSEKEHATLQKREVEVPEGYCYLDGENWKQDTEGIRKQVRIGMLLQEEQYFQYLNVIRQLEELIKNGESVIGSTKENHHNL